MKTWKKVTAVALAVCLLVSGMTMSASAAEATKVSGDFLAGANLNLNEGIAIQFLATTTALSGYTDTYLSVEYLDRDATAHTKIIEPVAYGDYMNYKFDAISPDRMADDITATLYGTKNGTKYQLGETITYSVKTYVANTYANTKDSSNALYDDTVLQTLLADILYYGEMSRLYTGVDAASPLADWVASTKTATPATPYASDASSSVKNLTYPDGVAEHISWSSVGLNLRENPAILYKFKLTNKASGVSNYKLVVEDAEGTVIGNYTLSAEWYDKTERCYTYRFRGLNPTKMGEKVSAYFVNAQGAKVSAVLDYSVESFANFCYNETVGGTQESASVNTELYNLTQAVIAYGESARYCFGYWDELPLERGLNLSALEDDTKDSYFLTRSDAYTATFKYIADAGFDHVRLPVDFRDYSNTSGVLTESKMTAIDKYIEMAHRAGLIVFLDFHGWADFKVSNGDDARFIAIWENLANRYDDQYFIDKYGSFYKRYSNMLVFELINEPHTDADGGTDGGDLNMANLEYIQTEAADKIRAVTPDRTICFATVSWNSPWSLKPDYNWPDHKTTSYVYSKMMEYDNAIIALHSYNPTEFTHQGMSWMGTGNTYVDLTQEHLNGLNTELKCITNFLTTYPDKKVIINEIGLNTTGHIPNDQVLTYLKEIIKFTEANDIPFTYWAYGDGTFGPHTSTGSWGRRSFTFREDILDVLFYRDK